MPAILEAHGRTTMSRLIAVALLDCSLWFQGRFSSCSFACIFNIIHPTKNTKNNETKTRKKHNNTKNLQVLTLQANLDRSVLSGCFLVVSTGSGWLCLLLASEATGCHPVDVSTLSPSGIIILLCLYFSSFLQNYNPNFHHSLQPRNSRALQFLANRLSRSLTRSRSLSPSLSRISIYCVLSFGERTKLMLAVCRMTIDASTSVPLTLIANCLLFVFTG